MTLLTKVSDLERRMATFEEHVDFLSKQHEQTRQVLYVIVKQMINELPVNAQSAVNTTCQNYNYDLVSFYMAIKSGRSIAAGPRQVFFISNFDGHIYLKDGVCG